MKRITRLISIMVCIILLIPAYSFAGTASYTVAVGGYVRQSDARGALIEINNYRHKYGLPSLVWDNNTEGYHSVRAAELALFYSYTRPNGEAALESTHGYNLDGTSLTETVRENLAYDSEFQDEVLDEDLITFCGSVFKSYDGVIFFTYSMFTDQVGESSFLYDDESYTFTLDAKDGYLNCKAVFKNYDLETYTSNIVYEGAEYNYWIYNYNENAKNTKILLQKQYSRSSNPSVASIDEYGTVIAHRTGTTTLTIKPSANSNIEFTKKITVKKPEIQIPDDPPISKGQTVKAGGAKYKVLSASSKTVAFTKAPNKKSVTVPDTVTANGVKLKVTEINAKAFTGKKIRKITIGKNVKELKKNAFKGSKATKIIVKSKKLTKKASVKGSLTGSKVKTIQVKVGKKSVNKQYIKKYKKVFTKNNAGKKVALK